MANNLNSTYAIPNSESAFGRVERGRRVVDLEDSGVFGRGTGSVDRNNHTVRSSFLPPIQTGRNYANRTSTTLNHHQFGNRLDLASSLSLTTNKLQNLNMNRTNNNQIHHVERSRFEPEAEGMITDQAEGRFLDDHDMESISAHESQTQSVPIAPIVPTGSHAMVSSSSSSTTTNPIPKWSEPETDPLESGIAFNAKFLAAVESKFQEVYAKDLHHAAEEKKAKKRAAFEAKFADLDRRLAEKEAMIRSKKEKIKLNREKTAAISSENEKTVKEVAAKCTKVKLQNEKFQLKYEETKAKCNLKASGPIKIAQIAVSTDKAYCPEGKLLYSASNSEKVQCDYWNCPAIKKIEFPEA